MSSLNPKKRLAILAAVACFMLMSHARPHQVTRAPVNPWRIAAKLDTCLEGMGLEEVQGSTGWRGLRG